MNSSFSSGSSGPKCSGVDIFQCCSKGFRNSGCLPYVQPVTRHPHKQRNLPLHCSLDPCGGSANLSGGTGSANTC
eukprot:10193657-Prorocentrum_lima.AAC.1